MRSLLASLGDHSMAMLRAIAGLRGVTLATNVREEVAEQLAIALLCEGATEAVLSALSPAARTAWDDMLATGGQIKVPVFTRRHGAIRPVGPGRLEREANWRQPSGAAEELWYQGLIYRAFADLGDGPLEYFYIPDDLRPAIAGTAHDTLRAVDVLLKPAGPPPESRHTFNSLAVDACAILAALASSPLRITDSGAWRAADEARLRENLLISDSGRFALLISLGRQLGWLALDEGRLAVQGQVATAWLRKSAWDQTSELFRAWQNNSDWNDLRHVPSLRAEGTWRNDPLIARRAVLAVLAKTEAGAWYPLDDLVAAMKAADPDFQRPDGNYTGWYLKDVTSGSYFSGFESWDDVEGRLVRFLVEGPLFWLGAVALAPETEGQARLFSLTTAGAYWISGSALPDFLPPARLAVSEQFEVTAPLLVPLYDRFRLLRFTEPMPDPYEPGQPTRHRITRRSLGEARARGVQGEKIVQFLHRATEGHLPPRVEAGLLRWDQHGGAVRISKGAVVRVEDATILAALRADPVVAPLLGELLSAQAALVREPDLPRLLSALAGLGYSVKVD